MMRNESAKNRTTRDTTITNAQGKLVSEREKEHE